MPKTQKRAELVRMHGLSYFMTRKEAATQQRQIAPVLTKVSVCRSMQQSHYECAFWVLQRSHEHEMS